MEKSSATLIVDGSEMNTKFVDDVLNNVSCSTLIEVDVTAGVH